MTTPCPNCGGTGGGTLAVSWGRWARPYVSRGRNHLRVCVGWVTVTYLARDLDCTLAVAMGKKP